MGSTSVPAKWYGMVIILLALIAFGVAGIIWLVSNGLEWWWIASGALVVLVFILFSFLAYRKVAIEKDKVSEEMTSIVKEKNNLTSDLALTKSELTKLRNLPPPSSRYIPDSYVNGRIIYMMDLLTPSGHQPIILKRKVEDCEVHGPAMVFLMGTHLDNCGFDAPDAESVFVEVTANRWLSGVIGLQNCTFRRCKFIGIGLVGTREQIEQAKKGFIPPPSHDGNCQLK
jgi:hypothetical protein